VPSAATASPRLPRAERERQILAAAHGMFAAHGFGAVTMDEVAAEVGVTKPLLYAYWGNKERLYLACLERDADALAGAIGAAVATEPTPTGALETGMRAFFAFVDSERGAFRVLFDETLPAGGEMTRRVAEHRQRILDVVAGTLLAEFEPRSRAKVRTEVEALSHALLGSAEALARWWLRSDGELTATEAAELLISTVAPGLRERSS
jgi:AcrR family transcriptional regulator